MDWEAVGSIGEIIGAVGVVITLLYIAVQVRQNTSAVVTASFDSVMDGFNNVNSLVIQDEAVAKLFRVGNTSPEALSSDEAIQYAFLMRSWANQWLKILRLREGGVISEEVWRPIAQEAGEAFATPGGRIFRQENQLFADLYAAIDQYPSAGLSSVQLGASMQKQEDA